MAQKDKPMILVIEDEKEIAKLIQVNLVVEGYDVECSHTGEEGIRAADAKLPDLILLDLMLPGMDGLEIIRRLRAQERTRELPIIVVTAKGEENDVIKGLELGADDYISKPFSIQVLLARVSAVLRRASVGLPTNTEFLRKGDLSIHLGRHEVSLGDKDLDLTKSEFQILHFLAQRPGWVFTRGQIVDAIRGENYAVTERSIDVQVVGLRKKLGHHSSMIETVRGVGYRFKDAEAGEAVV